MDEGMLSLYPKKKIIQMSSNKQTIACMRGLFIVRNSRNSSCFNSNLARGVERRALVKINPSNLLFLERPSNRNIIIDTISLHEIFLG